MLELGFTWPLPEDLIVDFMRGVDEVLVLEELEPLLENDVRVLVQKHSLNLQVKGKGEHLSRLGEYSTAIVRQALAAYLGIDLPFNETNVGSEPASLPASLPGRPPILCAGCSHRGHLLRH